MGEETGVQAMSDESAKAVPPISNAATNNHKDNGMESSTAQDLSREVVMLRARCSNLRHWCRLMLEDPATIGVLPEDLVVDLRRVSPEVSESEGHEVVSLLTRGGNIPSYHPLAPATLDPIYLSAKISQLNAEREQLRQAFFSLYDRLHPGDDLTDEYFHELISQGSMLSMSEVLAEIEREFGDQS
jgi:hypothetical protein